MGVEENKLPSVSNIDKDSQAYLLELIRSNELSEIISLLEKKRVNINHIYDHPYYKPPLSIALQWFNDVSPQCIQLLLDYGADPLLKDDEEKNAINYAAESNRVELLKTILKHLNQESGSAIEHSSIMFSLMEYIKDEIEYGKKNLTEKDFINTIEILLEYGVDINKPIDDNDQTIIHLAALYGFKDIVTTILTHEQVNLDNYRKNGKTARDLIIEKQLFDLDLLEYYEANRESIKLLFKNLQEKRFPLFKHNYESLESNLVHEKFKYVLISKAVDERLDDIVEFLLNKVSDKYSPPNEMLLEEACSRGYFKIVELFMRKNPEPEVVAKALLVLVQVKNTSEVTEDINYNNCLDKLLEYKELKINYKDTSGKTALDIAAKYQPPDMSLKILRKGASLANTIDIEPETLKLHLDDCMEESTDIENKYFTIKFTSLLPPGPNTEYIEETEVETEDYHRLQTSDELPRASTNPSQEMTVLNYMSKSPKLKHLLEHPVIMIFLFLKWYNIRCYFYINVGIHVTFLISLAVRILLGWLNTTGFIPYIYILLFPTYIFLIIREIVQMLIYKLRYITNFENWLEIVLLTLTVFIISGLTSDNITRQISAAAIVISGLEFFLLSGQFEFLSTDTMVLRKVSCTFFKLFCWCFVLFLAFAFSFHMLFQETDKSVESKTNDTRNVDDKEQNFFLNFGLSLFKTIIMLTGEFEADSIKFNLYPITSHLIFIFFVFLIAIVLFNLLNGLAISDTQTIKNDAELYNQILRIQHIAELERILLNVIPKIEQNIHVEKILRRLSNAIKIRLFPLNVLKTEINVYQNQSNENMYIEMEEQNERRKLTLEKKIRKVVKAYLQDKREEEIKGTKERYISKKLNALKEQLDNIHTKLDTMLQIKNKL